nr:unnamed protein product [Callosobruchus analis]
MKEAEISEDIVESYQEDPEKEPTEDYYCYLHCLFTEIGKLYFIAGKSLELHKSRLRFSHRPRRSFYKSSIVRMLNQFLAQNRKVHEQESCNSREVRPFVNGFKIASLVAIWIVSSFALMANNETVQDMHQISIPSGSVKSECSPSF